MTKRSGKPTSRQIEVIRNFGFEESEIPPTRHQCFLLIGFILEGNKTVGSSTRERSNIALYYVRKWKGKRVRVSGEQNIHRGKEGVVQYLQFLSPDDVGFMRNTILNKSQALLHPARARIQFDPEFKREIRSIALSALELVED